MKEMLRNLIDQALMASIQHDAVSLSDFENAKIDVSRTKDPRFGDYATNAALVLAGPAGLKPRQLAEIIKDNFPKDPTKIAKIEVAGPGFINLYLAPDVWNEVLHAIHFQKEQYGTAQGSPGPRVLLEFVSANPTGPLHVGHGRGAAVGDTLANLLRAAGYNVQTEYYVNDAGNQMKILGRSLLVRLRQQNGESVDMPDNHYVGEYMVTMAAEIKGTAEAENILSLPEDEAVAAASKFACAKILDGIKDDLAFFGVTYNNYFSERYLHESGAVKATLEELRLREKAVDHEGALWFVMNGEQDEKDRVLVRATGEPTYFAADAAYHENKLKRGFELLVDIWGSDHHGYVPRVKASMEALGHAPDALKVLLVQFVNLIREGRKISMSTRSGEFITLREVLDEVGPDAARFFFLTKRSDSHLDFDLDLAKKQSKDNPVYYVQYAHARVSSIFRIGAERNIDVDMTDPDLTALSLNEEQLLIKRLSDFPDVVREAAESLEPHRITFYLIELAELFHSYYHDNKILIEDAAVKKARLYLAEAVRLVVANGLKILGVNAPERM
jgi:arginyl-tRNA synthetase